MGIRVRQVYAPVFFLCFFFCAATKCPHLDQRLYFSSLATKFIEADQDDKKSQYVKGWERWETC